jgi:hypothetical protein
MTITLDLDGDTILSGPVVDQPALHGLLIKVRELRLTLISVDRVEDDSSPGGRMAQAEGRPEAKKKCPKRHPSSKYPSMRRDST